jgi:hypothetical protein
MHNKPPVHPSGDPLPKHYSAPPAGGGVLFLAIGLFFTVIPGCIMLSMIVYLLRGVGDSFEQVVFTICPLPFVLVGLALTLSGLYQLVGKRETYFNPDTGAMLHRGTLLGIAWREKVGSPLQHIPIDIPPIEAGEYPPSISLLREDLPGSRRSQKDWYDYATTLFKASLISLLTQNIFSLYQATTTESSIWGRGKPETETFLRPGKNFRASLNGELENRIMMVMRDWSSLATQDDRLLYPQGITIKRFTGQFLKRYLGGHLMVINTVLKDAAKRNLGTANTLTIRWKPDPAHASRLDHERARVGSLIETFARQYPDLDREMHDQIRAEIVNVDSTVD